MLRAHHTARTATGEPLVASALLTGIRGLLLQDGRWEAVRARLLATEAHASEWVDAPLVGDWHPAEWHFAIMRALLGEVGVDGIRAYARRRLESALSVGALAPILRSWLRSYSTAAETFLRVNPHVWSASTRNMGRMIVLRSGAQEMVLRVVGAPPSLRRAEAWHRFLEGFSEEMLAAGGYQGKVTIGPAADAADAVDGHFRWD